MVMVQSMSCVGAAFTTSEFTSMPELPEAEVAARQLRDRVVGATVRDCWVGRDDIVREGLSSVAWYRQSNRTEVERRGKSVIFTFARNERVRFLAAELGMTGLLVFRSTRRQASPAHPFYSAFGWSGRTRIRLIPQPGYSGCRQRQSGNIPGRQQQQLILVRSSRDNHGRIPAGCSDRHAAG